MTRAAMLGAAVLALAAAGGCKKSGPTADPPAGASAKDVAGDQVAPGEPTAAARAPSEPAPPAPSPDPAPPPPATADKDNPVTVNKPPPTAKPAPAQDTARYVAWMSQRGRPVKDTPREVVELRAGDWGFFDHGGGPGQALDRAALDKASHVVQPMEQGHWHAFLTTPGLDAAGALKRVAWLFSALELGPSPKHPKVTAPVLETAPDGSVKLQGWLAFPPNMSAPMRLTITATPAGAKLVHESAKNL